MLVICWVKQIYIREGNGFLWFLYIVSIVYLVLFISFINQYDITLITIAF